MVVQRSLCAVRPSAAVPLPLTPAMDALPGPDSRCPWQTRGPQIGTPQCLVDTMDNRRTGDGTAAVICGQSGVKQSPDRGPDSMLLPQADRITGPQKVSKQPT